MSDKPASAFASLLRKLVRVPKEEIDEQERKYQESRDETDRAKPGEMLPKHKTGT